MALFLVGLLGCNIVFGEPVSDQTVTAACGLCIFGQPSGFGCYWAIEWEGVYYPVNGSTPADHEPHAAEGMCTMPRQAVVSGRIRKGRFVSDEFDLLPVDPSADLPTHPVHSHEH